LHNDPGRCCLPIPRTLPGLWRLTLDAFGTYVRLSDQQEQHSEDCTEAEKWNGERSKPASKPKFEHRHIVTCPPLTNSEGTSVPGQESDAPCGKNRYRHSEPAVTSPGDDAEPQITKTGKLTEPDGAMEHPEPMGTSAEFLAGCADSPSKRLVRITLPPIAET